MELRIPYANDQVSYPAPLSDIFEILNMVFQCWSTSDRLAPNHSFIARAYVWRSTYSAPAKHVAEKTRGFIYY